jgi:uncharacterized membrane protein YfcA
MVTTGIAAGSHAWNKNIDWPLFRRLVPAGVLGGAIGAYLLTGLPELPVKIFVVVYLAVMALMILRRLFSEKSFLKGNSDPSRSVLGAVSSTRWAAEAGARWLPRP